MAGLAAPSSRFQSVVPAASDWEAELARILASSDSLPPAAKRAVCDVLESLLHEDGVNAALMESARSAIAVLEDRKEAKPGLLEAWNGFVALPAL